MKDCLNMKKWLEMSEVDLEAHQKLDEQEEAFQQKQDAAARAMGFSCDLERMQCLIQEQDRKLEQYCAGRGITLEQYYEEQEADYATPPPREIPKYFLPDISRCSCEGHIIPAFCPNALVEIRTQDMNVDDFELQERKHRIDLSQVSLLQNNPSKRLSSPLLERYWELDSQQKGLEMPFWAKGDEILQQIDGTGEWISPVPLSQSPQLSTLDSIFTEEMDDEFNRVSTATPSRESFSRRTTCLDADTNNNLKRRSQQVDAPIFRLSSHLRSLQHTSRGRPRRKPTGTHDKSLLDKTAKICKSKSVPARHTRLHKITEFGELALDGTPRSVLIP